MTNRCLKPALLLIVALSAVAAPAAAQRPMTLVDLLNVPRLSDPRLSPDGRDIVYVQAHSGRGRARGAADDGRRWRDDAAMVARRKDDRVRRETQWRRVRADLPAVLRRRRSAQAHFASDRRVGSAKGARPRPDLLNHYVTEDVRSRAATTRSSTRSSRTTASAWRCSAHRARNSATAIRARCG